MKSFIGSALVLVSILGLGQASQAAQVQPLAYHGTDALGLAIVTYKGETYHLTEGDKLAGETYVANEVSQILVKVKKHHKSYLVTIPFTK